MSIVKIGSSELRKIDFNLGAVFLVFWQERRVTFAARRLALRPAAVSAALTHSRATAGAPLFVRTRTDMEPTPRAEVPAQR
jgi:LysR family transcriptional regulator, mexEF-oprN operon transcriptional activator